MIFISKTLSCCVLNYKSVFFDAPKIALKLYIYHISNSMKYCYIQKVQFVLSMIFFALLIIIYSMQNILNGKWSKIYELLKLNAKCIEFPRTSSAKKFLNCNRQINFYISIACYIWGEDMMAIKIFKILRFMAC